MPRMYVIVKFLPGCEVALVSSKWLRGPSASYWPPIQSEYKRAQMVRNHVKPGHNWPLHEVDVLYHHTDYNMAVRRLSLVENRPGGTPGSIKRSARKRKRPERLIETMESETSGEERPSSQTRPMEESPASPTTPESTRIIRSSNTPLSSPDSPVVPVKMPSMSFQSRPGFVNIPDSFMELMEVLLSKLDESIVYQRELDRKLTLLLAREPTVSSLSRSSSVIMNNKNHSIDFHSQQNPRSTSINRNNNPTNTGKCSLRLPLFQMRDFESFERQMADPVLFEQMVSELGDLGGTSLDEVVRSALKYLLAAPLALCINWTGKNDKRAFQDSKSRSLVVATCYRNPYTAKIRADQIDSAIKFWFRSNCERERIRLKRACSVVPVKRASVGSMEHCNGAITPDPNPACVPKTR